MTFLIVKIFVYLLLAGGIGFGAGWLMRNLQAQKQTEDATRAMNDAKAKLPQLESLVRGRDEQLKRMRDELTELKTDLKDRTRELKQSQQEAEKNGQELLRVKAAAQEKASISAGVSSDYEDSSTYNELVDGAVDSAPAAPPKTDKSDADRIIAELSQEIAQLKAKLASAARSGDTTLADAELDAARLQIRKLERELAEVKSDLEREKEHSQELENERELQNKSLQVLHQQLELERSRRAASA